MRINRKLVLGLILFFGLLVRIIPLDFPNFTADEARVGYRGYTLATEGRDELGRNFPFLFNSHKDYQFPLTSYLTALGEAIFGKSDFGARLPFVVIGVLLILPVFKISQKFSPNPNFHLLNAFLIASSPVLIYLSKVPNEIIVLTTLFTVLYYFLNRKSQKLLVIVILLILISLTSKMSFFILPPFVIYSLYQQKKMSKNIKKFFAVFCISIIVCGLVLFFTNPQAKRSFIENNFSIVSDLTISNGINTLRGEGLQANLPAFLERVLFNKLHFLPIGFLHWSSHFNPALFFGQLDPQGKFNFLSSGAFAEFLIFPLILGIVLSVKSEKRILMMFPYFLIMTFPAFISYPRMNLDLLVLILPFIVPIIALGLVKLNKILLLLLIFSVIFKILITLVNIPLEIKKTNEVRPYWVKELARDIFESSKDNLTAISDTAISDIAPFIQWYSPFNPKDAFLNINSPYKYIQYDLGKIKIINSETKIDQCSGTQYVAYLGERDLNQIKNIDIKTSTVYGSGNRAISLLQEKICLD